MEQPQHPCTELAYVRSSQQLPRGAQALQKLAQPSVAGAVPVALAMLAGQAEAR